MTSEEYRTVYLRSEHWRVMRLKALERAEHRCQVCNVAGCLDVHHRTYERLGAERVADLTVLCRACHDRHHDAMAQLARPARSSQRAPSGGTSKRQRKRQRRRQRGREKHRTSKTTPLTAARIAEKKELERKRREVWDALVNR